MNDQVLQELLRHPKRHYGVIIITLLTGLVVVWPASDEYFAAKQRTSDATAKLKDARAQLGTLPRHQQLYEQKVAELSELEKRVVSEQAAQVLQAKVTELGRKTGCSVRKALIGDAARRDWRENDDPIEGTRSADAGADTPFQLETRELSLLVTGPMVGLYGFLSELHQVDKLIHTKDVSIESSTEDGATAALRMTLKLFDLPPKPVEKI
jgi:hypothetical protein